MSFLSQYTKQLLRRKWFTCLMVLFCMDLLLTSQALPQNNGEASSASAPKALALVQAVMCEGIKDYRPLNPAIVFSHLLIPCVKERLFTKSGFTGTG